MMANENRLIDANALSEKFKRSFMRSIGEARAAYRAAWEETLDSPIVDAAEVVHGRWEYWAGGLAQCSVCGYEYTDYLECKNYCGNCGAKMDGGNEDG